MLARAAALVAGRAGGAMEAFQQVILAARLGAPLQLERDRVDSKIHHASQTAG
jgi:hypothetical protein